MTENHLYTLFRNEQTNLCDCAHTSRDIIFNLDKYGPYLDKIRDFFMPSLEYRVRFLLEEFVYSINFRWDKQFPCFKKFIDAIVMWKDPLSRVAEYDINTMEEMMKSIIKRMIKNNQITYFLDSVILHHRLHKVCRDLDALGIEDNILRNLTVWNFVNEQDYLLDCNCLMDFNTTMDYNMNLNTMPCNSKRSIKYKKTAKPLIETYNRSTMYSRPTKLEYQEHRWIADTNQNFLQRKKNSNHYSTSVAIESQNNSDNKMNETFNEKSCNTKLKKIRNGLKLKIIVHKIFLEDYKYSTFSSFKVMRLLLPCKSSNLVGRIFEADPSLTESCLIVIKQKFENNMHNICSCLNSILEKLNIKLIKALCLNCIIYPGYISFKLKASNMKKCLFVARVPICQNVHKYTIQQDNFSLSSKANSKPSTEINKSKCFVQYKNSSMNFNDTFEYINEENDKFVKNMSQNEAEDKDNNKEITSMITENDSRYIQNFAVSSCNNSCKDIIEEISNMSYVDNFEEGNKEFCQVLSSIECNNNVEKCKKKILESNNSITKIDTSTQLVNNINCLCLSYKNFTETNDEIKNISSNENLNSFSHTSTNDHRICLSNKRSNLKNEVCNTNACSITSFVSNSEYDKQLVELNYNHFSNNNINAIDKRFNTQENNSSLNSAKVEIGCDSCCSSRCNDFIYTTLTDITIIDDISKENIACKFETFQDNFDVMKAQSTNYSKTVQISPKSNNLLTISVQIPKSTILSKGIHMDKCYSRTVWLISDDENISDDTNTSNVIETSDRCNKMANLSHTLIVSKKRNKILSDTNKEIFNVKDRTQDFLTPPKRFSNERFRSNEHSRNSGISIEECLCAANHSTSNTSLYYRSFVTSKITMNNKRDESQKSDKLKKMSKFRRREYVRSRNDIRNITSTTIKHKTMSRKYPNDYSTEIQPQTIFTMTKFRNSIDKSVDRIKRLIRAKLGRILFKKKTNNNNKITKTLWKNEESSENIREKKTSYKCIRQGNSITSCSTCNCYKQCHTISSRESSNVILTIRRTKKKRKSEENIKFRDHRLINSSKTLNSSCLIKISPWSYDLLTSTTEDIEKQESNKNRYDRNRKNRNIINYNRDFFHRCDFTHSGTSIKISSRSTKISITENDPKYFGHYTYKRQEDICDNKQVHNQYRYENEQIRHEYGQYKKKNKYSDISIKYTDKDMSDDSLQSNDNLHKRPIFAILTDAYNDYMNDLDLDFKLRLLRYVELCKSIKRSLMRTLRSDDVYEVSTASVLCSDL